MSAAAAGKRVALVATGGTIDSLGNDRLDLSEYGERRKWLSPAELIAKVPEIAAFASVDIVPFDRIGLTSSSASDWVRLNDAVERAVRDGAEAVVVTHGTNVLEETAFFLNLSLKVSCPVVVAGAMRPASGLSSDGEINMLNAFRVATAPDAAGKGVLVVLNDTIHAAREATKSATHSLQTFASRNTGPLGFVDADGRVAFYNAPLRKHTMATPFRLTAATKLPRVEVLLSYHGTDGALVDAAVAAGAAGIVSAGTGAGKPSPEEQAALQRAQARGVTIVQSSRVGSGRVLDGERLQKLGFVAADDHSPWKARILLMLALGVTSDRDAIQSIFLEH